MADTRAQGVAQTWVVEHGLAQRFPGVTFAERNVELVWGGVFKFDAVSRDGKIIGAVSTSSARTAGGRHAMAKFQKLKTDALYLLHVKNAECRVMVFTEADMLAYFEKETRSGRFPPEIELLHVALPDEIQSMVLEARATASKETSPVGGTPG